LPPECAGAAELAEHVRLDLSDPLAADAEFLPDFAERPLLATAIKAEPQPDHLRLARLQVRAQRVVDLARQRGLLGLLSRRPRRGVGDQVCHGRLALL